MNPVFGARRRAEEFHELLEANASTGELPDARHDDLLAVVATLRLAPATTARPEFVADLRSRLMLAAEGALAPAVRAPLQPAPVRRSPRERRIAAVVGGFAIVSATASMAVAAQTALPGDTLYPLKRAIENAQTGVQSGADDKGSMMLDNASGRLEEVGELSRADDQDPTAIAQTLDDFVHQASEASDLLLSDYATTGSAGSIDELRSFAADSIQALESLESVIPSEARAALIEASMVIRQIDEQALTACPACSSLPLTQVPDFASKTIPILSGLIDDDGDSASTKPVVTANANGPSSTTRGHQSDVGGPTTPPTSAPIDAPDAPAPDPVLPTGDGHDAPDPGRDDPLAVITAPTSNANDPISDLITGTSEVADEVLGGLSQP